MKTSQVMILLNYIYQGVTQIEQEELKDFLLICEDLQVQGLIQKSDDRGSDNCGVETVQLEKDGNSETITLTQEDKHEFIIKETPQNLTDDSSKTNIQENINCTDNIIYTETTVKEHIMEEQSCTITPQKIDKENKHSIQNDTSNEMNLCVENQYEGIRSVTNLEEVEKVTNKRSTEIETKEIEHRETEVDAHQTKAIEMLHKTTVSKKRNIKDTTVTVQNVSCPGCKLHSKDEERLRMHMKTMREVQCDHCGLYFRNCNSLCVHVKYRCRNLLLNNQ